MSPSRLPTSVPSTSNSHSPFRTALGGVVLDHPLRPLQLHDSSTPALRVTICFGQQCWKIEREAEARRHVGLSSQKRAEESQVLLVRFYVGKFVHEGRPDTLKFVFQVSNPNHRPVTVWGAGMEAPEVGVSAPVIKPEFSWFPHELTDGQGFMFASSTDYFASELHHKRYR